MIFMPARRAESRTLEIGSTTFWIGAMSTPARSNIPPLLPKSFCMSTTITAVRAVSIVIGSGEASMIAFRPVLGSVMPLPPFTLLPYNDAPVVEATLHQTKRNLIAESQCPRVGVQTYFGAAEIVTGYSSRIGLGKVC